MAERQGFEPWMGYKPMPVFKTGAFNRSAISPDPCDYIFEVHFLAIFVYVCLVLN